MRLSKAGGSRCSSHVKSGRRKKSIGLGGYGCVADLPEILLEALGSKHPGLIRRRREPPHLLGELRVILQTRRFNGATLRLIFQPAEEMISNGEIMVKGAFDRFPAICHFRDAQHAGFADRQVFFNRARGVNGDSILRFVVVADTVRSTKSHRSVLVAISCITKHCVSAMSIAGSGEVMQIGSIICG